MYSFRIDKDVSGQLLESPSNISNIENIRSSSVNAEANDGVHVRQRIQVGHDSQIVNNINIVSQVDQQPKMYTGKLVDDGDIKNFKSRKQVRLNEVSDVTEIVNTKLPLHSSEIQPTSLVADEIISTTPEPVTNAVQVITSEPVTDAVQVATPEPVTDAVQAATPEPVTDAVQAVTAEPVAEETTRTSKATLANGSAVDKTTLVTGKETLATIKATKSTPLKVKGKETTITASTVEKITRSDRKCKPAKNVIFLKTHKTGSSTIINIMQRYAHRHDLKVALPGVEHFLGWPHPFQKKFVFEYSPGKKYNIICNHARFNKRRMLEIMQSDDTKIVTIIRDPLYQFESTSSYLNFRSIFSLNKSLNVLEQFFNKSKEDIYKRTLYRNTKNLFLVKNPVAYDMGKRTWMESDDTVKAILDTVKKEFDLVMISDYMSESLILLKDLLCWDLDDVIYFAMNKRPNSYKQKFANPERTREQVKTWNKIDYAIFEYYNQTFWDKIQNGGAKLQRDLKSLNNLNKKLDSECLDHGVHYDKSQPWFPILGYKLNRTSRNSSYRQQCEDLIRSEIDYTNLLKLKQTKHNWTIPTRPPKTKVTRSNVVQNIPRVTKGVL